MEELLPDTGAGASETTKASLKLPEHSPFVGYKKDTAFFRMRFRRSWK